MAMIKEMPGSERPQEKALLYGVRALSNRELLAVILRSGASGQSVLETADMLLARADGIAGISRMSLNEICEIRGISKVRALQIKACFELPRRIAYEEVQQNEFLNNTEEIAKWLIHEIGASLQEEVYGIYLDAHRRIVHSRILFIGTLDKSQVYPREVFRDAIIHNSKRIIIAHNHPFGTLVPSEADMEFTSELIELGRMLDIVIDDHFIVTQKGWISFKEDGLLKECDIIGSMGDGG